MELVLSKTSKCFNVSELVKGTLCYGKHKSWEKGKSGFISSVAVDKIIVQFHPGIRNITNHFHIDVDEVAAGDWEIRMSHDLKDVIEFLPEGGEDV